MTETALTSRRSLRSRGMNGMGFARRAVCRAKGLLGTGRKTGPSVPRANTSMCLHVPPNPLARQPALSIRCGSCFSRLPKRHFPMDRSYGRSLSGPSPNETFRECLAERRARAFA